jgi:chromosome segregation ATPase
MNKKTAIAILIVACVGLAVGLIIVCHQWNADQTSSTNTILQFSNDLNTATANLDDAKQVNLQLNTDLATNRALAETLSNQLDQTSQQLSSTQASLQSAQTNLQNAQNQITNLDQHVSDLEAQNAILDQRANDLSNTISQLTTTITDTQMKLAMSQTNNTDLESELQKQVAQKESLQRKFSDLNEVRQQVRKLKTDAMVSQRLQWIQEGIDPNKQQKGGQILTDHQPPRTATPVAQPNFDLNVEVGADGTVRVLTNAPPPQALPAQ